MWSQLGREERAAWGLYKGSGSQAYRVQLDLRGMVTQCSCPSRKYPCKHGVGLVAMMAEQPDHIPVAAMPDWVAEWITAREEKAKKAEERSSRVVDEEARARRVELREGRVTQGLEELALWLKDLVKQGLVQAPTRPYTFWDQPAARLVDAQAPGVARLVRELGAIAGSGENWQDRMVQAVGRLWLLLQAWRKLEDLEEGVQADVRAAVGFTVPTELVLASPAVRDSWLVAGQRDTQTERMTTRRTWLLGLLSGRRALVLEFAMPGGGFLPAFEVGGVMDAELCFYPSAAPLRALLKAHYVSMQRPGMMLGAGSIAACCESFGARAAANPWTERQPAALKDVVPVRRGVEWFLRDETGALPAVEDVQLLALSGGRPLEVFAEWDGVRLHPLLAVRNGRFIKLRELPA